MRFEEMGQVVWESLRAALVDHLYGEVGFALLRVTSPACSDLRVAQHTCPHNPAAGDPVVDRGLSLDGACPIRGAQLSGLLSMRQIRRSTQVDTARIRGHGGGNDC